MQIRGMPSKEIVCHVNSPSVQVAVVEMTMLEAWPGLCTFSVRDRILFQTQKSERIKAKRG